MGNKVFMTRAYKLEIYRKYVIQPTLVRFTLKEAIRTKTNICNKH